MTTQAEANQQDQTHAFRHLPEREQQLSSGTVRYREAGEGEPLLFVHGLLVNGRLWDGVAERLSQRHRCIVPDWPMGSHTLPMNPGADLAPPSLAALVAEFIEALGLEQATVVGNDSGGAVSQMLVARRPDLVGRLVLTNCDTHDNFPPFPFNALPLLARVPGGTRALSAPFRLRAVRRGVYGMLAKRPIPDELVEDWLAPSASSGQIREDLTSLMAGVRKRDLVEATGRLADYERPALLAWAPEDRFFPIERAERIAASMPDARVERIADAKTFVSLDQPQRLAAAIDAFVSA
jgi:pimeloyl-ACP methyl ester carboxylesterase